MDPEEKDFVYQNDIFGGMATISQALQKKSLDLLLADDKVETEKADETLRWYHGKISREAAEKLLKEGKIMSLKSEKLEMTCVISNRGT